MTLMKGQVHKAVMKLVTTRILAAETAHAAKCAQLDKELEALKAQALEESVKSVLRGVLEA